MGGSSGGSSQPSSVTQNTSNLPEYARPYFEDLMGRAQAESNREYVPYDDQRLAGFNANQTQTQQNITGMTAPGQYNTATGLAAAAGQAALQYGQYQPGRFTNQNVRNQGLTQYRMGPADVVNASFQSTPEMATAQSAYDPRLQNLSMAQAQQVQAQQAQGATMNAARANYDTNLQTLSMGPAQQVAARKYGALSMGPAQQIQAQSYSTPGMAAAQSSYRPDLEYFQMTPAERIAQQQQYAAPEMSAAQTD